MFKISSKLKLRLFSTSAIHNSYAPESVLNLGLSPKCAAIIKKENKVTCNNYDSVPAVLKKGQGIFLYDVDDKRYFDFLSGYSCTNQGHCHPRIIAALVDQASKLHHTSRAFHSDILHRYSEYITKLFGYDQVLPINTGVEGSESAVKLARKWGYKVKKIPTNQAKMIFAEDNYWGRSIAAISSSTDPTATENYGPFVPGFINVPFNDTVALEKELKDPNVCGFMVESIQGEGGIIIPDDDYLQKCRDLCTKYNVLFICDEIQTGLCRTGKRLCVDHAGVRPDMVVLGKALSGGLYPVSAVLADHHIMSQMEPGTHGSTYGGNPLGARVAIEALKVLEEENLAENAAKMGVILRDGLKDLDKEIVLGFRGKGLLNAIEINSERINAFELCVRLKNNGFLTKQTKDNILRLAPPLIINAAQIEEALTILDKTIKEVKNL